MRDIGTVIDQACRVAKRNPCRLALVCHDHASPLFEGVRHLEASLMSPIALPQDPARWVGYPSGMIAVERTEKPVLPCRHESSSPFNGGVFQTWHRRNTR